MPHKKIENRRATSRRWYDKHRQDQMVKMKDVARSKAYSTFKEVQACSVLKCEALGERHHFDYKKPLEIIWLCKKHHEIAHHFNYRRCEVDGCERKHHAKGMCHLHLKRSNPEKYA